MTFDKESKARRTKRAIEQANEHAIFTPTAQRPQLRSKELTDSCWSTALEQQVKSPNFTGRILSGARSGWRSLGFTSWRRAWPMAYINDPQHLAQVSTMFAQRTPVNCNLSFMWKRPLMFWFVFSWNCKFAGCALLRISALSSLSKALQRDKTSPLRGSPQTKPISVSVQP